MADPSGDICSKPGLGWAARTASVGGLLGGRGGCVGWGGAATSVGGRLFGGREVRLGLDGSLLRRGSFGAGCLLRRTAACGRPPPFLSPSARPCLPAHSILYWLHHTHLEHEVRDDPVEDGVGVGEPGLPGTKLFEVSHSKRNNLTRVFNVSGIIELG